MSKAARGRDFYVATADEIRAGRTTDIYFLRTLDILKKAGKDRTNVVAEVTAGSLPNGWSWGVLCGLEEVVHLLEGKSVSLWSLPEGSVFPPRTPRGIPVPVMILEGPYGEWALFETPVLGMICQASGIATKAARIRKLAGSKQILSFGVRRIHPGMAPLIERSVYLAGVDAITTPLGAEMLGAPAMGTMPHALVIVMGGPREAFAAVHKYLEAKIPRIALVDTYYDEKTEALLAVEAIPDLTGVRLDTPASRRGNFPAIVREVRWELDLRGHKDVQIFVSGSVDEDSIPGLLEAGVDGFGVGTSLSNAPTIDFAMDIVEVERKPAAKRGKFGGRKELLRCPKDGTYEIGVRSCPVCGSKMTPAFAQYLDRGRLVTPLPSLDEIRRHAIEEIQRAHLGP
jgi:nicotinate phosphoribosyltransferase